MSEKIHKNKDTSIVYGLKDYLDQIKDCLEGWQEHWTLIIPGLGLLGYFLGYKFEKGYVAFYHVPNFFVQVNLPTLFIITVYITICIILYIFFLFFIQMISPIIKSLPTYGRIIYIYLSIYIFLLISWRTLLNSFYEKPHIIASTSPGILFAIIIVILSLFPVANSFIAIIKGGLRKESTIIYFLLFMVFGSILPYCIGYTFAQNIKNYSFITFNQKNIS